MLLSPDARAGDWQTTLGMGVEEQFTDNVDLATGEEDRNTDLITTVTPSIGIRGSGGRVRLDLDYSLLQRFFKNSDNRGDTQHDLTAAGNAELWDRIVFVDSQATISRQTTRTGAVTSGSAAGQDINRTEVRTLNVSPYLLHHLGTWVETESRLSVTGVTSDSDDTADTFTTRETFTAQGGRRFQILTWTATVNNQKSANDNETPTSRRFTSQLDFSYNLHPEVSLLFGGGYEKTEDGTLTDNPAGPTWNAGFDLHPSRRSSLRVTYGDRFETKLWNMEARHELSSRTTFSASYGETIQTAQQAAANNATAIGTDPAGNIINVNTGLPFSGGGGGFGFSDNAFRQKSFSAQVTGQRGRNRFNAQVTWESRTTDATGVEEIVTGGSANVSRDLSRRLSGSLGVSYQQTDFGTTDSHFLKEATVTAGLSYLIFRDVEARLNYILTKRDDNVRDGDLTENAVTVGLRKDF